LAGLFTDKHVYREILTCFYVITREMEWKLDELSKKKNDVVCRKILSLGYRFTPQYEKDMEVLWSIDDHGADADGTKGWKERVEAFASSNAVVGEYRDHIRRMDSGEEVAGATFVLWGALIIGGGAVAYPRAKKLVDEKACNVFSQVIGPGREDRKRQFASVWETLATPNTKGVDVDGGSGNDGKQFDQIVLSCRTCMQYNNDIFSSLQRNPWWTKYLISSAIGAISVAVGFALAAYGRNSGGGEVNATELTVGSA